eukprot:g531.t1
MEKRAIQVLLDAGIAVDGNFRQQFERDGFAILRGFSDADEIARMKKEMTTLVDDWDTGTHLSVFRTDAAQQAKNDYFTESANNISFFVGKSGLREGEPKINSLNKCGHALHWFKEGPFQTYSQSLKVAAVAYALNYKDPILPQSMYIFKNPASDEVTSHVDSTFLYTTPRQTCLGLWLALDAASVRNGCLWVRPGSHREPLRRIFKRNANGKTVFVEATPKEEWPSWEGALPGDGSADAISRAGFQPAPCEPGDLLVLHGNVDHLSMPNTSELPRHTYQLHLVEGERAGITWSSSNWLQTTRDGGFPRLSL